MQERSLPALPWRVMPATLTLHMTLISSRSSGLWRQPALTRLTHLLACIQVFFHRWGSQAPPLLSGVHG